jgi:hypothetical protein
MRRIISVLAVSALMAAMMLAMALPVFAAGPETGTCAQGIAQSEETVGNPGQVISTACVGRKPPPMPI